MKQSSIVSLYFLYMIVHPFHVGLSVLEGMCEDSVLRLQVIDLSFEMFVVNTVALELFSRCPDAIGDKTFDDLLRTVAVLEGVDEG